MGDRWVTVFRSEDGWHSPGVYSHNYGHSAVAKLTEAAPSLRHKDASYSAARLAAYLCNGTSLNLGVGIVDAPTESDRKDGYKEYSHGDAGVIVVDCVTWKAQPYAGYLKKKFQLPIPPE